MGCCISTNSCKTSNPKPKQIKNFNNKSPPRPEEETVKEIVHLSQPQKQDTITSPFIKSAPLLLQKQEQPLKAPPRFYSDQNGVVVSEKSPNDDVSEEVSSTVSVSENREEPTNPVHEAALVRRRPRTLSKSPGRGTDRSSNRVRQSPVRGRDNNSSSREVLGRRSQSPVTRVDPSKPLRPNTGRINQAGRRTIQRSPNRVGPELARVPPATVQGDESLENPLVSLECFIFL